MITLIAGPMYSGKSTGLLSRIERSIYGKKRVALIRPKKDDRGYFTHSTGNSLLETFIKDMRLDLYEVSEFTAEKSMGVLDTHDDIFVDEYFMIKNCALLAKMANEVIIDQNIYFAGLLATSENKLFPEAIELLPYCDEIEKRHSVCMRCGAPVANYSMFIGSDKKETIVVGDTDKYQCVCKKCYKRVKGEL